MSRGAEKAVGACRRRCGQAMVESCVALIFICLLFFLFFQLCLGFASRDVLDHAAARAARARTVGFNQWMVHKAMRVAAIPNAGRLLVPNDIVVDDDPILNGSWRLMTPGEVWDMALTSTPTSPKVGIELARIPDYLYSPWQEWAEAILDYERWDDVSLYYTGVWDSGVSATIRARVRQPLDMLVSVVRGGGGILDGREAETLNLEGSADIENHYSLYLDDQDY
ncbi:MAG: hypothetical protein FJ222_00670 [Lentisphaerae bacterium]|nr:hypothetical protein [Lentisphaerota bacterium]